MTSQGVRSGHPGGLGQGLSRRAQQDRHEAPARHPGGGRELKLTSPSPLRKSVGVGGTQATTRADRHGAAFCIAAILPRHPCERAMAFAAGFSILVPTGIQGREQRDARVAKITREEHMRKLILAAASVAALAAGRTGIGAVADRHQVQPRGGFQHAQGRGGGKIQGTGREIYRRQGQGRDLSELDALQGQGRTGGAAARRGADAGAVEFQVRPDRGARIRGVRSALHSARPCHLAQSHRRPARRQAAQAAASQRA